MNKVKEKEYIENAGSVFSKKIERKYKDMIYWTKMFLLVLVFSLFWVAYSFWTQHQQQVFIEEQKRGEIQKIEQSFNPDIYEEKIQQLLSTKVKVDEIENEKKEKANYMKLVLNDWNKETQSLKTEELKKKLEEEALRNSTAMFGNVCVFGSWDSDKKLFFNTFNYSNSHLVKNYIKRLDLNVIDYQMICFQGLKLTSKYVENISKKVKQLKTMDEKKTLAKRQIESLKRQSTAFYQISFSKKNGMSELSNYSGCWNDEIMGQVLSKIGVVPLSYKEISEQISKGLINGNISCTMPKANNLFFVEKSIPVISYYENLFKDMKTFNENKNNSSFQAWYKDLTYSQGIDRFLTYVNTETFKGSWSVFSKGRDLDKDYILPSKKVLIKEFFTFLGQTFNK